MGFQGLTDSPVDLGFTQSAGITCFVKDLVHLQSLFYIMGKTIVDDNEPFNV